MDRRRFIPSSEALDQRTLLSSSGLFGQNSALGGYGLQTTVTPDTFNEKLLRIQRIPYYLDHLQPGRFLSPATVQSLQVDIMSMAANLRVAPPPYLRAFNLQIREMIPKASLSPQDVGKINQLFGAILTAEHATPEQVTTIENDMLDLAKADAASPNPVYLATNDYSILVQAASIMGRRIETPTNPLLALGSGERAKTPGFGATTNPYPTFVGTYRSGEKVDPGTQIEITSLKGNLLGTGTVILGGEYANRYRFALDQPLQPGINWLRIHAVDPEGHASVVSTVFAVKLVVHKHKTAG